MNRLLFVLLFVSGLALGQTGDLIMPIDLSTPALQIQSAQNYLAGKLKDPTSTQVLVNLQAAKLALYQLSDDKQSAALDFTKLLTDAVMAYQADLNAQIAEYQAAQNRQSVIIQSYIELYGPLP